MPSRSKAIIYNDLSTEVLIGIRLAFFVCSEFLAFIWHSWRSIEPWSAGCSPSDLRHRIMLVRIHTSSSCYRDSMAEKYLIFPPFVCSPDLVEKGASLYLSSIIVKLDAQLFAPKIANPLNICSSLYLFSLRPFLSSENVPSYT